MPQPDSRSKHEAAAIKRRTEAEYRVGWKMAGIGMEVAAQVAGGALLGWAVDAIFGTHWGVLTGAIIGLVVGIWTLIKGALKLNKQLDAMGTRPRPRKLETPTKEVSGQVDQKEEDLPSWREEWDEWKDEDGDERPTKVR